MEIWVPRWPRTRGTIKQNKEPAERSDRLTGKSSGSSMPRVIFSVWRHCAIRLRCAEMGTTKPCALVDTRVIYCGDNLDQLGKLPDACVDLTGQASFSASY